jgi:hypothetical protein
MEPPVLAAYIGGLLTCGYVVAGGFFLSFWFRTRDGLFGLFALAFWLMALNQALPILLGIPKEEQSPAYLLRLAAFVLIIIGILRKNLGPRGEP